MARRSKTRWPHIPEELLPPVKASVEIVDAPPKDENFAHYSSRIMHREDGCDYLDALRNVSGEIPNVSLLPPHLYLLWGTAQDLYVFRIAVDAVLDPLPSLRIRYLESPRRHNRRQAWRSNTKISGSFIILSTPGIAESRDPSVLATEDGSPRRYRTMTRDISYSALRFYARYRIPAGSRLSAQWHLPDGTILTATMVVVPSVLRVSVYRGIEGRDVVARWDPPLAPLLAEQWHAFCDHHRYD